MTTSSTNRTSTKSPAISVNVPIYNPGAYLRECLDSLASQNLKNIEFILVDDGSTDGSGKICDEYAAKDSRFKVIHKPNGGVASARQAALDASSGEYVIICDSDDWVEPEMYETLYTIAKETDADIVECGYFRHLDDDKVSLISCNYAEYEGLIVMDDYILRTSPASWNKLIRRALFTKNKIAYVQGINMGEDKLILYKILKKTTRIVRVPKCLYHYRRIRNNNSYTNHLKPEYIFQMADTYNWIKENYPEKKYQAMNYRNALNIVSAFLRLENSQQERVFIVSFLRTELNWGKILKNKPSIKSVVAATMKVLPLSAMASILNKIYPIFYR
ncbi:MAG: glycosyltransferase [Muribaculaceae bacterium]|nr:glycosyltransferase [Muribaculaceae bacterium]